MTVGIEHRVLTTAQVAELVTGHLAAHGLPEPASLHLTNKVLGQQEAAVQLDTDYGLAGVARELLAWAATLTTVRLGVWRPEHGRTVHVNLHSTLIGPHGGITLHVYGGAEFDPAVFADLEPEQARPVSLGELTAWAVAA